MVTKNSLSELVNKYIEQFSYETFMNDCICYEKLYGIIYYKKYKIIEWGDDEYDCINQQLKAMLLGYLK